MANAKGASTRLRIVQQAAPIFNQRGFAGAALSEIMAATGLEKGGIYRHFRSKDDLALAAFDYFADLVAERLDAAVATADAPAARVLAILELWVSEALDPPVAGGCMVMNTAIESDDTHPALRERARLAMTRFQRRIATLLREGQAIGELDDAIDADAFASVIVATLEGGLMLTRLYGDGGHVRRAADHIADTLLHHRREASLPNNSGNPA